MTQLEALDILKLGHNVFLTGPAGSGKTYTLNKYIDYLRGAGINGVAITASTGIAATHLGGMTIHAWSGLGIRDTLGEHDIDELESRPYLWKRYDAATVLVIDEVSMLHDFRFDLVDKLCRSFKRKFDLPFGGMQVILCGDFFQLPPISRPGERPAKFIPESNAWKGMNLKVCYLEEQHRQSDDNLLTLLNAIRSNEVEEGLFDYLIEAQNPERNLGKFATKLFTHNVDVDKINAEELAGIDSEAYPYIMLSRGSKSTVENLKKSCLAPENLYLKVGAKVMFVKNNYERGYVNGTLGEIVGFDTSNFPIVKTVSGNSIIAAPESWRIEEDGKLRGEITQLPLRLAWAITVHKSQGMSLDAAEIDLSKSFVPGMGYVALSRVRTLNGLKLLGINGQALRVDESMIEFDATLRKMSEESEDFLNDLKESDKKSMQSNFLQSITREKIHKEEKTPNHRLTQKFLEAGKSLKEIADSLGFTKGTIVAHIEKLYEEGESAPIEHIRSEIKPDRFQKIYDAFGKSGSDGEYKLAPVRSILGQTYDYDEIRLVRLFLLGGQ